MYPVLRRAAAATQRVNRNAARLVVACVLFRVPAREPVAPMRRRRREGVFALRTTRRATVTALASTATRAHGRGRRPQWHAAPARPSSLSRRFRRLSRCQTSERCVMKTSVKRAAREAGGDARKTCRKLTCCVASRARAGDVFKVSSLERSYASPAVCSRLNLRTPVLTCVSSVVLALCCQV